MKTLLSTIIAISVASASLAAESNPADTKRGDEQLSKYFRSQVQRISESSLAEIKTLSDWQSRRDKYRQQLFEMLGLDPLPERTPLEAVVTGKTDHEQFTVEKIQFQSRPGLYVTGNLYVPKGSQQKFPTVLYVCGHGNVVKDGVSYGSKAQYQHHGAWFARHGYVCLTIDTLQLGEIRGLHHGTSRENMWWWMCLGYTPAGVEAWNCIRSLDYLQSRPEVDGERIGVTGRSGGGAYSWWIAALDERIAAAVPVAGITDLENHVVDGCIEGHCDCMYMTNTYQWDYAQVAALVAPRPLLIANTDKDGIFPLEGIQRIHQQVRKIYRLYGAENKLGLQISEGPHKDIQELQVAAFRWFNRFLKKDDPLIETAATKLFQPEQLKVFADLPSDEKNTQIHESFAQTAQVVNLPESESDWTAMRNGWLASLREKTFRGWPADGSALDTKEAFKVERHGIQFTGIDYSSQEDIRLRLYLMHRPGEEQPKLMVLNVLDDEEWTKFLAMARVGFADELMDERLPDADQESFDETAKMFKSFNWAMAYLAPRGIGPTLTDQRGRKPVQNRRRYLIIGQTLDGMQVWDVRRAVQVMRTLPHLKEVPLWLQGHRQQAGVALYASIFEPDVTRLDLWELPRSHREGPYLLNILKTFDMPQAVAMAASRAKIRMYQKDQSGWEYPQQVAEKLGWDQKQIQLREPPKNE